MAGGGIHIDRARFEARYAAELPSLAGDGRWNTPAGPGINETKLAAALDHADAMVEGAVRSRYPDGLTDETLTDAACDIARYRLRSDGNATTISKEVRDRYLDARAFLKDVRSGEDTFADADGRGVEAGASGPGGAVMATPRGPERSDAVLDGYR